jgi:HK97 family phage major capsid protein
MVTYNSLTTRSDADALIPVEVSREILQGAITSSAALRSFRTVRMSSAQTRQPVLSALPQAYWVDGSSDTGLKQTTEMLWGNKYLDVRELAVILPIPEAVLDDAEFDIWGEVRPRLSEAFGAKLDAATLMNVDNPWPQSYQDGIVTQAYNAGNYVLEGTGVDFADDVALNMAEVEDDGFDVNVHYARRRVRSRLRRLRAPTTNEPLFTDLTSGVGGTLYGEPLEYVSSGPWVNNYELISGDREQAIIGVRQDITFRIFTEGVITDANGVVLLNLMQQDAVAMRAVGRFAFAVASPVGTENPTGAGFPFSVLINSGS